VFSCVAKFSFNFSNRTYDFVEFLDVDISPEGDLDLFHCSHRLMQVSMAVPEIGVVTVANLASRVKRSESVAS